MQERTSPTAAATSQNTSSRELAVAAIKEALNMIGEADQVDQPKIKANEDYDPSEARFSKLIRNSQRTRIAPRMLIGVLALMCVGFVVLAWQLSGGKAAPEPIVTSSLPTKTREELAAKPAPNNSPVAAATQVEHQDSRAQAPQDVPIAPAVTPMPPELAHQSQDMARELANVEQGIGQLKAEQSRIASEGAGLAELLKQTREVARHNTELTENLKATQAQIAHQISELTDQLKASQDLMTTLAGQLRENQEQIAHLEQKQRPRPPPPPSPVANSVRRVAPKPPTPTAGVQARDPGHPQAGQ